MAPTENIAVEARRIVIAPARAVPAPSPDDPSDEELLRFLDGDMDEDERRAFAERLERSPYASARAQILADALADSGFDDPEPCD
ncbi:MAG TPA: hypothetical protein VFF06_18645 [Polyangia bacterium]|nr:hypothetical protein [Polyangia bacterium]